MDFYEDAAMPYNPDDEGQPKGSVQAALAEAERTLASCKGVQGMGISTTPQGQDAIVVYVQNEQTLSQLPADVGGVPILGDIVGEIRPQ